METVNASPGFALGYVVHAAAALGRRVLWTAESHELAREVFEHLTDKVGGVLDEQIATISRLNGGERTDFRSDGGISFISRREQAAGRGFSVSVLVIDGDRFTESDRMAALMPSLAASDNPTLVRVLREVAL